MKHHKTDDQLIEIKEFAMKVRDKQFWLYEAVVIICSAISMVILWANHLFHRLFLIYLWCSFFVPCFLSVVLWRGNYTKATNGGNWQDICFSSQP